MKRWMVITCRWLLGLTFVFSGLVKTIDPWGTALKIGEYLGVWGLGAVSGFLGDGGKMALAIAMCGGELLLGLLLVMGIKKRLTSVVALSLMGAFTVVTVLGATVLPVEDCGCFGDAVKLSPWESVAKNVVLLGFAVVVWLDARRRGLTITPIAIKEWAVGGVLAVLSFGLGVWCYLHLPLVDFLPFKRGVDLYEAKFIDEGEGDITLRQFAVINPDEDGTHELLGTAGRAWVLVATRLNMLTPQIAGRFATLIERAAEAGETMILVTGSGLSAGEMLQFGSTSPVEVYNMDAKTMITMLRARVGVVELYGGVIVDKKNWRDIE